MGLVPLCDRGGLCIVPPGPLGILRWCLRASQFGEPINSRNLIRVQQRDSQQNGIAKGSHRRTGAGGRPATVASGRCLARNLPERTGLLVFGIASLGGSVLASSRSSGHRIQMRIVSGRDEVSRKPCSRGRDRGARSPRPNRMRSHACSEELGSGWEENPHDVVEIANQCPNPHAHLVSR